MPKRRYWNLWIDSTNVARHLSDNQEKRTQIYETINRGGFDWQVWAVAASGFFTDSYNLFATNIILPSIAYLYWPTTGDDTNQRWELAINIATLGGSAVGQLLFGYLADRYGRRKLYGLELIIVIVSTLGLTQASTGYFNRDDVGRVYFPMSIQAWLIFYRLFQGIGIGGEYPMSAVITAEFASVKSRPRMMAAVFLMQPIATLLAAIVGLAAVYGYQSETPGAFGPMMNALGDTPLPDANIKVDAIWRCVIGVGAIPAFVAILFRLTIPESPRYTLDVDMDAHRALRDALQHYGSMATLETVDTRNSEPTDMTPGQMEMAQAQVLPEPALDGTLTPHRLSSDDVSPFGSRRSSIINVPTAQEPTVPEEPSFFVQLYQYLRTDGNWRWLGGASLSWFILDFAYYGLGINNPRVLAKVWANQEQPKTPGYNNSWTTGITRGDASLFSNDQSNIYYVLRNDSIRSIITTSIGAIIGSILLIQVIPYVPRKGMLTWTSVVLAVLLVVTGGSLFRVFETDMHALTITLYVLIQLVFNLGPNTLIFIFPAEIFPTRFRGTCYGIASASGKISAVIVQAILPYVKVSGKQNGSDINDATALGTILIIWGALMLVGALVSSWLLPEVQKPRGQGDETGFRIPNKTLEELAEGRGGAAQQDENFAARRRVWFRSKERDGTLDGQSP